VLVPLSLALLGLSTPARADLDVAFVLDTTGSMSGEIREARSRIRQLAEAIQQARGQERVRYGVVAYRDQGDAYITRVSPLMSEVEGTWRFLSELSANGGGDGPEDVIEGLRVALEELQWTPGAEHQLFLIGDAPPHTDYPDHPDLASLRGVADEHDVVIHAIGCRSLSSTGIAWFRELAYATEGQYHHIGRVEADSGGLADAMLQTLAPAPGDDGPLTTLAAYPSGSRPGTPGIGPEAPGVLVRIGAWLSPMEREPEDPGRACSLTVMLPTGAALADPPEVALGRERLHVDLHLSPGAGGLSTWELERCLPTTTAVETELH